MNEEIEIAEDHNPKTQLFDMLKEASNNGKLNVLWDKVNSKRGFLLNMQ